MSGEVHKMYSPVTTTPYWWEGASPKRTPQIDIISQCDVMIVVAGYGIQDPHNSMR